MARALGLGVEAHVSQIVRMRLTQDATAAGSKATPCVVDKHSIETKQSRRWNSRINIFQCAFFSAGVQVSRRT